MLKTDMKFHARVEFICKYQDSFNILFKRGGGKILKKIVNNYVKDITILINDCIEKGIFPDDLKFADVSPTSQKE